MPQGLDNAAPALAYVPVVIVTLFLNAADVFFLQNDPLPRLQRALSFWVYLAGHALVAIAVAWLLYNKQHMPVSDWPIVTLTASLSGFSVLQSFTLKFGEKGIDARELFAAWKNRVIADVAQSNLSRKRADLMKTAQRLAAKAAKNPGALELAIHQLAPQVLQDPVKIIDDIMKTGLNPDTRMAQWIAGVDLEFARNLADSL